MYRVSQFTKSMYRIREVADMLGVTSATIRNYDRDGKMHFGRSTGNQRVISRDDLISYFADNNLLIQDGEDIRRDVIYVRQGSGTNDVELDKQALYLISKVPDLNNPIVLKERSNDSDRNRPVFQKLVNMVCNNEINKVYVSDEDTLMRFGYIYLRTMFLSHCTDIIVLGKGG